MQRHCGQFGRFTDRAARAPHWPASSNDVRCKRPCWYSPCRAAASRWRMRLPGRSVPHSTCSWCASSECPDSPNSLSAHSPRAMSWCTTHPTRTDARTSAETVYRLAARERGELARREQLYRAGRAPLDLKHKTVILVDDGLATGSTMLAAVRAARAGGAAAIIVAAPVASREAVSVVRREADQIVILRQPDPFFSVGQWYEQFDQIEDTEVCRLLAPQRRAADYSRAADRAAPLRPRTAGPITAGSQDRPRLAEIRNVVSAGASRSQRRRRSSGR